MGLNRLSYGRDADPADSQDAERLQAGPPAACPDERRGSGGGCLRGVGVLRAEWGARSQRGRRRHILAVAEEMGFRPSRTARDLRSGTTRSIGLLLADITNPFYTEVAGGVVAAAEDAGYEVSVAHVGVDGARQADGLRAGRPQLQWVDFHRSGCRRQTDAGHPPP